MTLAIFKAVLFQILKHVTQLDYKKRRKTYIHQRKHSRLFLPTVEDKKETHAPGTVTHLQTMNKHFWKYKRWELILNSFTNVLAPQGISCVLSSILHKNHQNTFLMDSQD